MNYNELKLAADLEPSNSESTFIIDSARTKVSFRWTCYIYVPTKYIITSLFD